ncbi:MAG: S24 family peptidase [Thermoanaerobaculia bacterium]
MARHRHQDQPPPADWTPTQAVPDPILNNPYEEPGEHWVYQNGQPYRMPGRRPASYWYKTERLGSAQGEIFAEEERDPLPLVNALREDVRRWRRTGYRGASPITRDLLAHWTRTDLPRPLFFCQREAVETLIYLLELALPGQLGRTQFKNFQISPDTLKALRRGERPPLDLPPRSEVWPTLIDIPQDPELLPLTRLGCKMATGSGKTVVMAMIVAWAFCNRGRNPATTTFPNAVLICAPNLTVKERLQVLRPDHSESYYDTFDLVPAKYRGLLNTGRVLVTNWHTFSKTSAHDEGGTSYRVVDKGEETPEAFAKNRLGELADRSPILVLNDEGHHCWRPAPVNKRKKRIGEDIKGISREEKKELEEEEVEARVWLAGLDMINASGLAGAGIPSILSCIDLSATPFYLANSGFPAGSPFPWLVSDFGLVDAIESGIVKIPRLPVRDDLGAKDDAGRPDPKYFRLWEHLRETAKPSHKLANGKLKPEYVFKQAQGALVTIASQWKERFHQQRDATRGDVTPPVLIVVCDNTDLAQLFFERISGEHVQEVREGGKVVERTVYGESEVLPELANHEGQPRRTVRIDTQLLKKIESGDGETKDQAAKALREVLNTVGKKGGPGEHVRCVVSVSMLTEGWDASNVTHILGVRAFGSQLLCEQVVGRGLRRMSYVPDPTTKKLSPEYVDVYGIPFSLIPFKGRPKDQEVVDPIYHHIYAVQEKTEHEIRIPIVESYTYSLGGTGLEFDLAKMDPLYVDEEPTQVYLAPTRGYNDDPTAQPDVATVLQDRALYHQTVRPQQVIFRLAQRILEHLVQGAAATTDAERVAAQGLARHLLFPQLVAVVRRYVESKVNYATGIPEPQVVELALEKYANLVRERILDGVLAQSGPEKGSLANLLPVPNSFRPVQSTADVDYRTTRKVVPLTHSHLNLAAFISTDEVRAIELLDSHPAVESFTANGSQIGLRVPYEHDEEERTYEPDFVARLRGGKLLLIEIKGGKGEIFDKNLVGAKNDAARKWVAAVNNAKSFGEWAFCICRNLRELREAIEKHAAPELPVEAKVLPFRFVESRREERFVTCVPLVSLSAAAGWWSEEQESIPELLESEEWVSFDRTRPFEPGMFVARVVGRSMEPKVPTGSYCLFRANPKGSRKGRDLLVWHRGVTDGETGGEFTLKRYTSEKTTGEDGWQHETIRLLPLNPEFAPIVLKPDEEGAVRVIAELVEVVG